MTWVIAIIYFNIALMYPRNDRFLSLVFLV